MTDEQESATLQFSHMVTDAVLCPMEIEARDALTKRRTCAPDV